MAAGSYQHGIDAEGCGAAEYGADIRVVHHVFEYGHALGIREQRAYIGQVGPREGGKCAAGYLVGGYAAEHFVRGDVGGNRWVERPGFLKQRHRLFEPFPFEEER